MKKNTKDHKAKRILAAIGCLILALLFWLVVKYGEIGDLAALFQRQTFFQVPAAAVPDIHAVIGNTQFIFHNKKSLLGICSHDFCDTFADAGSDFIGSEEGGIAAAHDAVVHHIFANFCIFLDVHLFRNVPDCTLVKRAAPAFVNEQTFCTDCSIDICAADSCFYKFRNHIFCWNLLLVSFKIFFRKDLYIMKCCEAIPMKPARIADIQIR